MMGGPSWGQADGGRHLVPSHRPCMSNLKIRLGTGHDRVTSRTPSSAREEGFQIFMYFVHYNHFSRLQID